MPSVFYENFVALCEDKGEAITGVVQKLGGSKGNISNWRNGSYPNSDLLIKIADYFEVALDYLLGRSIKSEKKYLIFSLEEKRLVRLYRNANDTARKTAFFALENGQVGVIEELPFLEVSENADLITIPILGRAAAGLPIEMIENDLGQVQFNDPEVRGADFAVIASGDSMINAGINDGDIVVIKRVDTLPGTGEIALIAIDDTCTIKSFFIVDSNIVLVSQNENYKDQVYPKTANIKVLGKVVKIINKTNK